MNRRGVLITGCSGGGKSTLLEELARRGYAVCEEPGRRIVREELARGGEALPWKNLAAFVERCIRISLDNLVRAANHDGLTFFDRGLIDAVLAMERLGLAVPSDAAAVFASQPYAGTVFLAPPWPEIYENDPERKHGLDEALAEYEHIAKRVPELGYTQVLVPKTGVEARAEFVFATLNSSPPLLAPGEKNGAKEKQQRGPGRQ